MNRNPFLRRFSLLALLIFLLTSCGEGKKQTPETPGDSSTDSTLTVSETAVAVSESEIEEGRALYAAHCLVCHQVTGGGVPGLNPPLKGTEYVLGPKAQLVRILLNGSNKGLEIEGVSYANAMPGFAMLSNKELALVATYIRNSFGNSAGQVTESEVAEIRAAR